jgi:hypothetical protein
MDDLNADAGANFSGKIFDHCEKIYCLSFEEFDESFADYFLILVGGLHTIQNRFCQLFSVTFLQIFPEMSNQTVCKGVKAEQKVEMVWILCNNVAHLRPSCEKRGALDSHTYETIDRMTYWGIRQVDINNGDL